MLGGVIVPVPVHPRACGEHVGEAIGIEDGFGSSPRLRGTPGRFCSRG